MKDNSKYFKYINLKKRYKLTNEKISSIFKDYIKIEKAINTFIPNYICNIKKFIENQQLLIKELIHIINNILIENIYNSNLINS